FFFFFFFFFLFFFFFFLFFFFFFFFFFFNDTATTEIYTLSLHDALPIWIPSERELDWRIRAERWGDYEASLRLAGETYTKTVQVRQEVRRRSPVRLDSAFLNQLLYPAEDPLPENSPVESITLGYKDGAVSIFGWHVKWYIAFFGLSIIFAFGMRKPLRVTI